MNNAKKNYQIFTEKQKIDNSDRKLVFDKEDIESLMKQEIEEFLYTAMSFAASEILSKVLQFNHLDNDKYYEQIRKIVLEKKTDKAIAKAINKTAKQITIELKRDKYSNN